MIRLERIKKKNYTLFKNLYQFYIYELSEFKEFPLNNFGKFEDSITNLYLIEEDLLPYFIIYNEKVVGFILIQSGNWSPSSSIDYYIGEFFILRMYQKNGLGYKAIKEVFKIHKGVYLVGQISSNIPAIKFWNNLYKIENIKTLNFIEKNENYNFILQQFKIK